MKNNKKNKYIVVGFLILEMALLAFFSSGCSSVQKVAHIKTELEVKSQSSLHMIGIDEKGQAIIQREVDADNKLRDLRWNIYDLEQKIQAGHSDLERCRVELADPRLGGGGNIIDIPEVDTAKDTSSLKEEFGLTENGELKVVQKQLFVDKLSSERKYIAALNNLWGTLSKHKKQCERELGAARVKNGLPSNRYVSRGKFGTEGRYIQSEPAEQNLDDAFRFADMGRTE